MLTMRAKPPPEIEFIDIFQKFKLSFNLLVSIGFESTCSSVGELVVSSFICKVLGLGDNSIQQ